MRTIAMIGLAVFGFMYLQKSFGIKGKFADLNTRGISVAGFKNNSIDTVELLARCNEYKKQNFSFRQLVERGCD